MKEIQKGNSQLTSNYNKLQHGKISIDFCTHNCWSPDHNSRFINYILHHKTDTNMELWKYTKNSLSKK